MDIDSSKKINKIIDIQSNAKESLKVWIYIKLEFRFIKSYKILA